MHQNESGSLVGVWYLVSWVVSTPSGEMSYPYGDQPEGQLIYTADGHMSVQLMRSEAASSDIASPSPDAAIGQSYTNFFAYHGKYALSESTRTVTHHIAGCASPEWVGMEQSREYALLDDKRLQLTARVDGDTVAESAGASGTNVLTWERAR